MDKGAIEQRGITRRRALSLAGIAGAAYVASPLRPFGGDSSAAADPEAAAAASCVLAPEVTEGPYWVDVRLNRSNVIAGQEGVPLKLNFYVYRADDGCEPQQGAVVDIWHCNANGLYSDEAANGTSGQTWLRGLQETDADGLASFTTIYPGWYSGRTVHIHVRVRTFSGSSTTYDFTTQVFFNESDSSAVFATAPYNSRSGRDSTNATDMIYKQEAQAGNALQPTLSGSVGSGLEGTVGIGLSGLPAGSSGSGSGSADTAVAAKLLSRNFLTRADGLRELAVKIKAEERVAAHAQLLRGGKSIAHKRIDALAAGTRRMAVPIGDKVAPGPASLLLTLRDRAGNKRVIRRRVVVPKE